MKILFSILLMTILALSEGVEFSQAGPKTAGQIVSFSGTVLVRNENDPSGKMKPIKVGQTVASGEIINTSSDGAVKLLFSDKSILDIGPSTLFKVDEYELNNVKDRKAVFSMPYGKVRALVSKKLNAKGKFRIRTKSATMGVRGTEFIVASDLETSNENRSPDQAGSKGNTGGSSTQVTVVHGKVAVASEQARGPASAPKVLTQNQQIVATAATAGVSKAASVQMSKVVVLKPEATKAIHQSSKVVDKTFLQSVVVDDSIGKGGRGGADTLSAFADTMKNEGFNSDFIPEAGEMGFAGAFGADMGMGGVFNPVLIGEAVRLRVTIQK